VNAPRPSLLCVAVAALASGLGTVLAGCAALPAAPPPTTDVSTATSTTTTTAPRTVDLHLLFSSDEHGWLQPTKDKAAGLLRGGIHSAAATMAGEGFAVGKPGWLLLSAGDMWTGPYETTVLEGAPMAAAMRELGYRAAAVGNHDFDFGLHAIAERRLEGGFPFLGANLIDQTTGRQPSWAQPYVVVDVLQEDGSVARVGVIGLSCFESPVTADVRNMIGLEFRPYDHALEEWLPRLQAERPDVVVALIHDSIARIEPLIPILRKHRVAAVAAGHEHRAGLLVDDNHTADAGDDVVICNPGPYLRSMCRLDLSYVDGALRRHSEKGTEIKTPLDAPAPPFNAVVQKILDQAEASAAQVGGEVLVESTHELDRGRDGALGQFVVDAWLENLPFAHVALTNAGGLRQDVDAGALRLRDIVSALPFNNYLLVVDMTGAELREALANPESIVGGATYTWHDEPGGARVVTAVFGKDGKKIADDARLKVVINDFMYRGGDRYRFADREPEETAVDWREPLFRSLRALKARGQKLTVTASPRGRRD
jgi:2',3'-cyclic-nucleotide 2'-phosphodiesterase (5'-nucleotidase family)